MTANLTTANIKRSKITSYFVEMQSDIVMCCGSYIIMGHIICLFLYAIIFKTVCGLIYVFIIIGTVYTINGVQYIF